MSQSIRILAGARLPGCFSDASPAPRSLHVFGDLPLDSRKRVAVVGSRTPSPSGLWAAFRLGHDLARSGVVVVSGLARGIDSAAHRGALDGGGPTVAFLGSGWDTLSRSVRPLAEEIRSSGALVSEYEPGEGARPYRFVQRNRLMAAYARATVVVEAGEKSGALITAGMTVDRNGLLWALPGDPRRPTCRGSNRLLRDGVGVALGAEDVLAGLGLVSVDPAGTREVPRGFDAAEGRVWRALRDEGHADLEGLARLTRLPVAELLRAVSALELSGVLERESGRYALSRKEE
jgi:DNA processing protein